MTNEEILIARLNKIDITTEVISEKLSKIDIYNAKAEERQKQTTDCLTHISDRLDKHDERLKVVEFAIIERKPLLDGIGRWLGIVLSLITAAVIGYLTKGA